MSAEHYAFRLKNNEEFNEELNDLDKNYDNMIETLMGWAALLILEPYVQYRGDTEEDVKARLEDACVQLLTYTKGLFEHVYNPGKMMALAAEREEQLKNLPDNVIPLDFNNKKVH